MKTYRLRTSSSPRPCRPSSGPRETASNPSEFEAIEKDESPLEREKFLKVDPSEAEPWKGIMLRNSPGQAPAGAPVFIAQGTAVHLFLAL